jgi:osmotically inducible protein OsmC
MPIAIREAEIRWEGPLARGTGTLTSGSSAPVLGENKTPPERLTVSATCTLDEVNGAPRITTVQLTVRARVPGLDATELERTVGLAADLCPVSNALRGNVEIGV